MTAVEVSGRVKVARALAQTLLEGVERRWEHSAAVAQRAGELAVTVAPAEHDLLVAAAWLHDIGYSETLRDSGFHPLDGARYLDTRGWPRRLCALVAHHSGAKFIAERLGLADQLGEFVFEESPLSDALAYADQTVGPAGQRVSIHDRMAAAIARHGGSSAQAEAHRLRERYLLAAAERVEHRLAAR